MKQKSFGKPGLFFRNLRQSSDVILLQESPVAGFQHHRGVAIWPFLREGEKLNLVRESVNQHDRNAVAVYFRNDKLGYVPQRENATLAQMLDRGEKLDAQIIRLLEEENPWRRVRIQVSLLSS
ncbi:MAG: HIRAN domain-containing protein [Chromatiales bacterium]|jgi:hypothetical protein